MNTVVVGVSVVVDHVDESEDVDPSVESVVSSNDCVV